MDFLEYSDITAEIKGSMTPGKLKMTDQNIVFKNSKTGKVEQFSASDIELVNYQTFVGSWGLRIFLKNGTLHRFGGFKDSDKEKEKVAKFFSTNYKKDMLEKELSLKGWNWGTAKFNGSVLSFDIGEKSAFEIPLNHVSQCTTAKNEIAMEFHQNDDAPVSLIEMRFFIPPNELAGDMDPVEAFHQQVMNKASVISVSGDAIAIFREIQCLTPRGRYDIKIFQSFFQLHGKTFDYKIPISTVLRLFILPHKDSRQMFFVVSLDPPIKQGQTRYHFLVLLFGQEEETTIELPFTEEEMKEKYEGKLTKELSGPTYEVLGRVMKVIIGRKLTGPGQFIGHSGTPAVGCSFKAAAGYLYPLERGFIYVHKPPIHIRFEEINSVNFARGGGNTRSFDFEIELKSGTGHTFSSIEKEEYGKLFDFITSKKLNVKNRGKNDKANFKDDFGDSDNEAEPDAYLARVKAEAKERDEDDPNSEDDESTDEDFNPNQELSDVAEEYDSKHSDTESEESGEGGKSGDDAAKKEKRKEKKEKKHKSAKTVSEKPRRRRSKKEKDANKPKRPATAFMLWLNETREQIKSDNPGVKVTEIAKKAGELWRDLKDKSEWDGKASEAKEEYNKAMKEYVASGGAAAFAEKVKNQKTKETAKKERSKSKPSSSSSATPVKSGSFKSKEYVSDDDSSSDDEKEKASKRKGSDKDSGSENEKKKKKVSPKKESSDADDESDDNKKEKDSDDGDSNKKTVEKKKMKTSPKKESSDVESDDDKKKKTKDSDESDNDKKKVVEKKKKKPSPKKESSDAESDDDKKKKTKDSDESDSDKKKKTPEKKKEKEKGKNGSESEEILTTPPSSEAGSDSD